MHILTAAHINEVDRLTSERYGIDSLLLMENAAIGAVIEIEKHFGSLKEKHIRIFSGKGNNGGDGAAVARQLWMREAFVEVWLFAKHETLIRNARKNFDILYYLSATESSTISIKEILSANEFSKAIENTSLPISLNVDALLGTGLTSGVKDLFELAVNYLNSQKINKEIPICSLDIPSGLAADKNTLIGPCVEADLTVTFSAPKIANVLSPTCNKNGILKVVPIGSPPTLLHSAGPHKSNLYLVSKENIKSALNKNRPSANAQKWKFGHVLLVAGSRGKTGAAVLAANATLRTGAGLVTTVIPSSAQILFVATCFPEVMTLGASETSAGTFSKEGILTILELLSTRTVLAIGPGISIDQDTREFVRLVLEQSTKPTIIDADALNCLSPWPNDLHGTDERPIVLTPHIKEMARLTGLPEKTISQNPVNSTRAFATTNNLYIVLKGQRSLIAMPGGEIYVNPTGNVGMATAGSGDVLTGIIAGLIAQSPDNLSLSILQAVYMHGLAGDIASYSLGQRSLIASDIINHLSNAFVEFEKI